MPQSSYIYFLHPYFSDLPDDHPRITGVHEQYEPGEGITATCTSWHSNPPANLSWFINGEPVSIFLKTKFQHSSSIENFYC